MCATNPLSGARVISDLRACGSSLQNRGTLTTQNWCEGKAPQKGKGHHWSRLNKPKSTHAQTHHARHRGSASYEGRHANAAFEEAVLPAPQGPVGGRILREMDRAPVVGGEDHESVPGTEGCVPNSEPPKMAGFPLKPKIGGAPVSLLNQARRCHPNTAHTQGFRLP